MHEKFLMRISEVTAYFIVDTGAASKLFPQQSLLDKALEKIVEKTDKAENTCEKLMILIEKSKILEE